MKTSIISKPKEVKLSREQVIASRRNKADRLKNARLSLQRQSRDLENGQNLNALKDLKESLDKEMANNDARRLAMSKIVEHVGPTCDTKLYHFHRNFNL